MKPRRLEAISARSQAPWVATFLGALSLAAARFIDRSVPITLWRGVTWDEYQFLPHIHSLQTGRASSASALPSGPSPGAVAFFSA